MNKKCDYIITMEVLEYGKLVEKYSCEMGFIKGMTIKAINNQLNKNLAPIFEKVANAYNINKENSYARYTVYDKKNGKELFGSICFWNIETAMLFK